MAKKSSIEKNNRRRRLAKKFSGRRARLKAIASDKEQADRGAFCGLAEACGNAAQLVADPYPQPLRDQRAGRARSTASTSSAVLPFASSAPRA